MKRSGCLLAAVFTCALLLMLLPACGGAVGEMTCTVSVRCDTLCDDPGALPEEQQALLPADGALLPAVELTCPADSSALDVLVQACQENGVHMEYKETAFYGVAYVEGVGNLYELDAGPASGWTYAVNGEFPGVGCSQYQLQPGDEVVWYYTLNMGEDVKSGLRI